MRNILVTGGSGQLGKCLLDLVASYNDFDLTYFFPTHDELDITDRKQVLEYTAEHNIDIVVNCAAYTNVREAENDRETAVMVNEFAPKFLMEAMNKRNGFLIQISTDYVYNILDEKLSWRGGLIKPFHETGEPLTWYGKTKSNGEKNIAKVGFNWLIIRTSWLYSEYGNNFVKTVLKKLENKEEIKMVCDQIGAPTYARDLAAYIHWIIKYSKLGTNIINYCNKGVCSWYDFAMAIKEYSGIDGTINPCLTDPDQKPRRPYYSVMSTDGEDIPYWRDSLKKCINNLKEIEETIND